MIPFGGGTSVCGGVEPAVGGSYNGTISLDLIRLDRILEIDKTSRAARIQGGIRVPAMEAELKGHGLIMRHFPQSMELATLGGMIATRSGGTSPPSTPISTISSKASAWSPRLVRWRAAACPAPAPVQAPTG